MNEQQDEEEARRRRAAELHRAIDEAAAGGTPPTSPRDFTHTEARRAAAPTSSRESAAGAGWTDCGGPGRWQSDVPVGTRPLSWLRPSVLWQSRNDIIARRLGDPTDTARQAWIERARARAEATGTAPDFTFTLGGGDAVS